MIFFLSFLSRQLKREWLWIIVFANETLATGTIAMIDSNHLQDGWRLFDVTIEVFLEQRSN